MFFKWLKILLHISSAREPRRIHSWQWLCSAYQLPWLIVSLSQSQHSLSAAELTPAVVIATDHLRATGGSQHGQHASHMMTVWSKRTLYDDLVLAEWLYASPYMMTVWSKRTRYDDSMVKAPPIWWLSHQILADWLSASPYMMTAWSTRTRYDDSMVNTHSIRWQPGQSGPDIQLTADPIWWQETSWSRWQYAGNRWVPIVVMLCHCIALLFCCVIASTVGLRVCASPISQLQCRVTLLFQWGCNATRMSHQQRLLTPVCVMLSWLCTAKGGRKKGWTMAVSTVQLFAVKK